MKLHKVAQELGPMTVMDHLHRSKININPISEEIHRLLPMNFIRGTPVNLRRNLAKILREMTGLRLKKRILLIGPELIFLEELSAIETDIEVIVAVDGSLPSEAIERISSNIPFSLNVMIMPVPKLPNQLRPADSVMMAIVFDGGRDYALVPDSTRHILNFYLPDYFFGEVYLLDLVGRPCFERPEGWVTVSKLKFFTQHLKAATEQGERNEY